jgi:AraC family transcriptional regulator, arabinose operon regulatory protein
LSSITSREGTFSYEVLLTSISVDPKTALAIQCVPFSNSPVSVDYTKKFHLKSLSDELHLSQHYIAHLFHNSTGTNITEYLIARRIRQACWLLKNSTLSISEVCHYIGLTNVSYFCKKFKEYTGRTPLKYRKG